MPDREPPARRVALTGGIATGKSHVRARFEARGVPTIDSDTLARDAVHPGTAGHAAVVREFGADILDAGGAIDRRKLGAIVFADAGRRRALERIVHPYVLESMAAWYAALPPTTPVAIADIPLLYEIGREKDFDAVIVVACEPEEQVRRVMARDGLSEAESRQRVAAQLPIGAKVERADYVIRTDGSVAETDGQVGQVLAALTKTAA